MNIKIRLMKNCKPPSMPYVWLMSVVLFTVPCLAQNVAINEDGSLPDPKAILDIKSTSKGLVIPRMSTADRELIVGPKGLMVYDTTTSSFWYIWLKTTNAAGDSISFWRNLATGTAWSLGGNNDTNNSNFLGTTTNVAMNIRVNSLPSGRIDPVTGNTYWGYQSGYINTIGAGNTAAVGNTATGRYSLYSNSEGDYNTAHGDYSLYANITGNFNTAIGYRSLYSTAGSYNTAIGYNANISGNYNNSTAIGYGATVNVSNKVRIGNSNVTIIEGAVPFTVVSDGRFKIGIKEDVKGLDFILQLRPVTYQFDVKRFEAQINPNGDVKDSDETANNIRRSGFIAQEVEKAANAVRYDFSGIVKPQTSEDHYSLSYEAFVVPLVKAMQEQQELITAQNKKIADLQQQLNDIKRLLHVAK
jgi:trimeric autotransporter adhesin